MKASIQRLLMPLLLIVVGTGGALWFLSLKGETPKRRNYETPIVGKSEVAITSLMAKWDEQAKVSEGELAKYLASEKPVTIDSFFFPTDKSIPTIDELRQRDSAQYFATWKAYPEQHWKTPTDDESELMRAYLDELAEVQDLPSSAEFRRWADAAIESKDPIVRLFAERKRYFLPNKDEISDANQWIKAINPVTAPTIPHYFRYYAALFQYQNYRTANPKKALLARTKIVEVWQEWIEATADNADASFRIWTEIFSLWNMDGADGHSAMGFRNEVLKMALEAKAIHPWLKHILSGIYHYQVAWLHRGSGLAESVTDEGWKLLASELLLAACHLNAARIECPQYSTPYAIMIGVTLSAAQHKLGTPLFWYQQTLKFERDNDWALNRVLWSLESRWGGTPDVIFTLCEKCLDRSDFDSSQLRLVPNALMQIQRSDFGAIQSVTKHPRAVNLIDRLFTQYVKAYEDRQPPKGKTLRMPLDSFGFRNRLAAFLVKLERFADAAKLVELEPSNIEDFSVQIGRLYEPSDLAATAVFAAKSASQLVHKAYPQLRYGFERDLPDEDYEVLLKELSQQAEVEKQPSASRFYQHALAITRRAQQFDKGEWTPLTFENKAAGWQLIRGPFEFPDPQSIAMKRPNTQSKVFVDSYNRFPLPYVVTFEIEAPTNGAMTFPGVTIGDRDINNFTGATQRTRHFGLDFAYQSFCILELATSQGIKMYGLPRRSKHKLRVEAWPRWYTFSVDGLRLFNQADLQFEPTNKLSFGNPFGQGPSPVTPGEAVISNIRIRKINFQPPPEGSDELKSYYERAIEFDPEDVFTKYQLASTNPSKTPDQQLQDLLAIYKEESALVQLGLGSDIGKYYFDMADYKRAQEWFERQYNDAPRSALSTLPLSNFLATCPDDKFRNGQRAVQLADAAMSALLPKSRWYGLYRRAQALAEAGRFEDGLRDLNEADSLVPESSKALISDLRQLLTEKKAPRHQPKHTTTSAMN